MFIEKKQTTASNQLTRPVLKTEGPLCEKDEQGKSIERTKLLQKEAMEKWVRLKSENK